MSRKELTKMQCNQPVVGDLSRVECARTGKSGSAREITPPVRGLHAQNKFVGVLTFVLLLATLAGCAHYRLGADSLYAADVQTVYVPMIESDSYRRDLGERLTEAVIKEIELKTNFKVVNSPTADSVLSVRLLGDTRRTLAEDPFDAPRVLENEIFAQVTWLNRRRLPMGPVQAFPVSGALTGGVTGFRQDSTLIPASGQSIVSSQQEAIVRLAEQIVGSMEEPW